MQQKNALRKEKTSLEERRQEIKNNFTYEAVYDPDLFVINKPNNDDEISWKTRFSLGRSQLSSATLHSQVNQINRYSFWREMKIFRNLWICCTFVPVVESVNNSDMHCSMNVWISTVLHLHLHQPKNLFNEGASRLYVGWWSGQLLEIVSWCSDDSVKMTMPLYHS